ncbi:MAG: MMPL family transporter, partial [Planctomycetota bacterium]
LVGGSSAMLAMAIVGWSGGRVDAILLSMPSLVYVLGLSGSIHVINYYRDEVRLRGRDGAATRAMHHALFPCALAALTTAIGLASLFTSNLKPISNFGLYAALGVLSTLGVLFSYLPSALEVFAPRFRDSKGTIPTKHEVDPSDRDRSTTPAPPSSLAAAWAQVGQWITARHAWVSVACLAVLAIASLGLFKIKTSVQLLKLFDADARILQDYAWLENNFGKLVPMEILVRMPPEIQQEWQATADPRWIAATESTDDAEPAVSSPVQLSLLERVETIRRVRTVVTRALGEEGMQVVGQASSMDTFLAPMPKPTNRYSSARSIAQKKLMTSRDELLQSDYVKIERGGPMVGSELWRLSLRVSALSDVDYGLFIDDLKTSVTPVMQAYQIRTAILDRLASDSGGISGRQRVLILGSQPVEELATADLVRRETKDAEKTLSIDQRAILLSTLHELLGGERIKSPIWVDPRSPDAKITPDSEQWDKFLAAFDVVVDVRDLMTDTSPDAIANSSDGNQGPAESLASWIDSRDVLAQSVTKSILTTTKANGEPKRIPLFSVDRPDTPQVVYTGLVPVVYKAQRTLLGSLVESIMLAFVLIAIVMIVLLNPGSLSWAAFQPRHWISGATAGAISMIPNLFPVLVVFGMMGHLESIFTGRFLVDIGTMMTASVAMGVAVDDTIHFLTWFRQFIDEGKSRVEAVIETYRRVGPAMTQTTIVGGLGLFVFALSTFTPTQRFGTLMLVMLATALIGDLILLPALLAGPLGKFFRPRVGSYAWQSLSNPMALGNPMAVGNPMTTDNNGPPSSGDVASNTLSDSNAAPPNIPVLKIHYPHAPQSDPARRTR